MAHPFYRIIYCEADTGIVLNEDGSRWSRAGDQPIFGPSFSSLEETLLVRDRLLAQNANREVSIEFPDGRFEAHRDEKRFAQFVREREAMYKWLNLPAWQRIFMRKPKCHEFKVANQSPETTPTSRPVST